jgi:hypothetical protein
MERPPMEPHIRQPNAPDLTDVAPRSSHKVTQLQSVCDVRFGSLADKQLQAKMRFCPLWSNNGQTRVRSDCPLCANSGHLALFD